MVQSSLKSLALFSYCYFLAGAVAAAEIATRECSTSLIQSSPTTAICGKYGSLANKHVVEPYRISSKLTSPSARFQACWNFCLQELFQCESFSYNDAGRQCVFFFESLANQSFTQSSTAGPLYYDAACFGSNCPLPSPPPVNTQPPPSSSCTVLNSDPTPSGALCVRSSVYLKQPDIINSTVPYNECTDACTARSDCHSLSTNGNNNTCLLYGETLTQQGITNIPNNTNIYYSDVRCFNRTCTDCNPPKPAKPFTTPAPSSACTPQIQGQLVKNPSFESSGSAAPWVLSGGAQLIQNQPANASAGNNFIKLAGSSSSTQSLTQVLTGLQARALYRLRFYYREALRSPECQLSVTLGSTEVALVNDDHGGYTNTLPNYSDYYSSPLFKAQTSLATLKITLTCTGTTGDHAYFVDNVQLIRDDTPSCGTFYLQVSSPENANYDGAYATITVNPFSDGQYYFSLASTRTTAKVFEIDGFGSLGVLNVTNSRDNIVNMPLFFENNEDVLNEPPVFAAYNEAQFGDITCALAADKSLRCVDRRYNFKTFRYCNACQYPFDAQLVLVDAESPLFTQCSEVTLYANAA